MYSKDLGWTPQTREQRIGTLYNSAKNHGFTSDYTEFKGSNIHRIHSATTIPALEQMDDNIVTALTSIFTYMERNYKDIAKGSYGASYEGWTNSFRPLSRGLNLVDSTIDSSLGVAGNIALYFDMLDTKKTKEVEKAWLKCVWPGMITPRGDNTINLQFSTANGKKSYKYYNLLEQDYTALTLKIRIRYKAGTIHYPSATIIDSVTHQFDAINHIGRNFYPSSYFDHATLPNIASMEIWSSLASTIDYSDQVRVALHGQKYIIKNAQVEVIA